MADNSRISTPRENIITLLVDALAPAREIATECWQSPAKLAAGVGVSKWPHSTLRNSYVSYRTADLRTQVTSLLEWEIRSR